MAGLIDDLKAKVTGSAAPAASPTPAAPAQQKAEQPQAPKSLLLEMWEPMPVMVGSAVIVLLVAGGAALSGGRGGEDPAAAASAPAASASPAAPAPSAAEQSAQQLARSKPVEAWLAELADKAAEPKVRWTAAQSLGRVGKGHDDVDDIVLALSNVVRDEAEHMLVRQDAVKALGAIGPEAKPAVAVLRGVHASDKSSAIRAAALEAANLIQPGAIAPAAPKTPPAKAPTKK